MRPAEAPNEAMSLSALPFDMPDLRGRVAIVTGGARPAGAGSLHCSSASTRSSASCRNASAFPMVVPCIKFVGAERSSGSYMVVAASSAFPHLSLAHTPGCHELYPPAYFSAARSDGGRPRARAGSRGIGRECCLALARQGASVAIVAKSVAEVNPNLPGTII